MDPSQLTVYNLPPSPPLFDAVGIFYITFCATWTTIIVSGMIFCLCNLNLPVLRVRGLPLTFFAITLLHIYWICAQITYPIGRTMAVVAAYDAQYFVMGTIYPLGIALFHASNLRFLRVAKLQRQFVGSGSRERTSRDSSTSSWFGRMRHLEPEPTTRAMVYIGIGMVFQCLLCAAMWAMNKKYHPSFGIPGTEISGSNVQEQLIDLGRGWEWWPSVVWQLIWTWIVAPSLIWRAWGIRDTLGWRTQTIGTCVAGLHAIPMFLIASYVPAFEKVNVYFSPSEWIHLTTFFIEIFVVLVPTYHGIKALVARRRITAIIQKWDSMSNSTLETQDSSTLDEKEPSMTRSFEYFNGIFGEHLLTMSALERFLEEYPATLQEFSAYHDFSGENIAFLVRVSQWKASVTPTEKGLQRPELFSEALKIYMEFISPRDADFPLNLFARDLTSFADMFEGAARTIRGDSRTSLDTVLPFAFEKPPLPISRESESESTDATGSPKYVGPIPDQFDATVFDSAQNSVKWLVLTNTWPKFIKEMQLKRQSELLETDTSDVER